MTDAGWLQEGVKARGGADARNQAIPGGVDIPPSLAESQFAIWQAGWYCRYGVVESVDTVTQLREFPGKAGLGPAQPGQVAAAGVNRVGDQDPAGLLEQLHRPARPSGGDRGGRGFAGQ